MTDAWTRPPNAGLARRATPTSRVHHHNWTSQPLLASLYPELSHWQRARQFAADLELACSRAQYRHLTVPTVLLSAENEPLPSAASTARLQVTLYDLKGTAPWKTALMWTQSGVQLLLLTCKTDAALLGWTLQHAALDLTQVLDTLRGQPEAALCTALMRDYLQLPGPSAAPVFHIRRPTLPPPASAPPAPAGRAGTHARTRR